MKYSIALWAYATLVIGSPLEKRQSGCTRPIVRRSWNALNDAEKRAYIDAELCLQQTPPAYGIQGARSVWDELQYAHIANKNWIHGVAAFLPWHRYYVAAHEQVLRTHCGYTMGTPYWEESLDSQDIAASIVWSPQTGFGGNGQGEQNCVADGPFSNLTLVINGNGQPGDPYCLARNFNRESFRDSRQEQIDQCFQEPSWRGASACYENVVHTSGHEGVGRVMADALLAPGDPIFFLHHANLDRLWALWQSAGLPQRLTEMNRPNIPSADFNSQNGWTTPGPEFTAYSGDEGTETTLNHVLWMAGIVPNATIADVMDLNTGASCAVYE